METGYYSIHEKVYVVYGNKGVIMNMKNGEIREQSLCVLYVKNNRIYERNIHLHMPNVSFT